MNPIFTIPYGEYLVANYLKLKITKCSVFMPTSHNERDLDLLLYNRKEETISTIQVKSARPYFFDKTYKVENNKEKTIESRHRFSVYKPKKNVDWNIFVCFCLENRYKFVKRKNNKASWGAVMLALNYEELKNIMNKLKNKNGSKAKFFEISIDKYRHVYLTRGVKKNKTYCLDKYLIEKRLKDIKETGRKICF